MHSRNYGFTKTLIQDNNCNILQHKNFKWNGDYDGNSNIANINISINNNNEEFVITNNELTDILKIQPVEFSLDKRLITQFLPHKLYKPIFLEGALIKSRRHKNKHYKKKKTRKSYYHDHK
jgi:hypothetical protein